MTDTLPRRGTETPATTPRAAAPAASASTVDVGALPVVRLKHWFRWTLAAIIVFWDWRRRPTPDAVAA